MNSEEFAWKDISINFGGRLVAGATEIKWKLKTTKTRVFASGKKAHTITTGNDEHDGNIKMLGSEVIALEKSLPKGALLTHGKYQVTVALAANPGDKAVVYQITDMHITEYEMGMAQNDGKMEINLPFMALDIKPV